MKKMYSITFISYTHGFHNVYAFTSRNSAYLKFCTLMYREGYEDLLHKYTEWDFSSLDFVSPEEEPNSKDGEFRIICKELVDYDGDGHYIEPDGRII